MLEIETEQYARVIAGGSIISNENRGGAIELGVFYFV